MIELRGVCKQFGATWAAHDLTLSVGRGECVVLLGPSGSGKSTALKLINRLVERDAGEILFDGRDIRSLAPEQLRRQMGYAIQSIGLFPHWSVARNVGTVPALLGWDGARIASRIDELLALMGLPPDEFRHRRPHQLSGGQQQRVGVARALAARPQVLLMDEPFGALDPLTRRELQAQLSRIHRTQGQTIVLVTHDVDEALRLGTRIVLMNAGRIVQEATPLNLLRHPANDWVRDFMGRADAGLRQLALRTVAGRMNTDPAALVALAAVDGVLRPTMSLREALAEFLARRRDSLPVVDDAGRIVGVLGLTDLVREDG